MAQRCPLMAFGSKKFHCQTSCDHELANEWARCSGKNARYLRIGSCLACVYRVMDARGKFGEHERSVRVARGAAESTSSFLSALQTSQVHPKLDIRTAKSMNQFFYNMAMQLCSLN